MSHLAEAAPTGSYIGRVCEIEGQLTGLVFGRRGTSPRQAHVLSIGLGVLRAWWGRGIGRNLMLALEAGAREHAYHRLELTVQVYNERASALYESLGYEREGLRRHGFKVNGTYVDLYYMSKLI